MSSSSDLLLVAGRSGAGKSAVSEEVSSQLAGAGVGHCLIEGDWIDRCVPQAPSDLFDQNLRALWRNYEGFGCSRMIFTNWASIDNAERIIALMGGERPRTVGVLLVCTDETARRRLTAREHGGGLEWHLTNLAASNDDSDLSRATPDWAHRIPTDGRSVIDIATEVVELTRWRPSCLQ